MADETPSAEEIAAIAKAGGFKLRPNYQPEERVVVGSKGEERDDTVGGKYQPEYSAAEKAEIAEQVPEEVATFVAGGLKLKEEFDPRPRPGQEKSADEVTRDVAIELAHGRKVQADTAKSGLDDHRLARAAEDSAAAVVDAYNAGQVEIEDALDAHRRALASVEQIDDDALRHATYERLEAIVAEDVYEEHVGQLQHRYTEHHAGEMQQQAQDAERQIEETGKVVEAVIDMEARRLERLPEATRFIAGQMLQEEADSIAAMQPKEMWLAIRYAIEAATEMTQAIAQGETEAEIVRAWPGKLRGGWGDVSRRDRRELTAHELGLARDAWTPEMGARAHARARAGIENDSKLSRRVHFGTGPTGAEQAESNRERLAQLHRAAGKLT